MLLLRTSQAVPPARPAEGARARGTREPAAVPAPARARGDICVLGWGACSGGAGARGLLLWLQACARGTFAEVSQTTV